MCTCIVGEGSIRSWPITIQVLPKTEAAAQIVPSVIWMSKERRRTSTDLSLHHKLIRIEKLYIPLVSDKALLVEMHHLDPIQEIKIAVDQDQKS